MQQKLEFLYVAAAGLALLSPVSLCVMIYRMWLAIQDGRSKLSPAKAVGLLAIPGWNLYWLFRVLAGYAPAYNAFIERHQVDTPQLSRHLILAALVLPGIGLFIHWFAIGSICDGTTRIANHFHALGQKPTVPRGEGNA